MNRKRILVIVAVLLVLIVGGLAIFVPPYIKEQNNKKAYAEGVAYLEAEDYQKAVEVFTELGEYEDSAVKAAQAQETLDYLADLAQSDADYQTISTLHAAQQYQQILEILEHRSELYGTEAAGTEAATLASEYEILIRAVDEQANAQYKDAITDYQSLTTMKEQFVRDVNVCKAHLAKNDGDLLKTLMLLYALQTEDYEMDFLSTPISATDKLAVKAYEEEDALPLVKKLTFSDSDLDSLKNWVEGEYTYYEEQYQKALKYYKKGRYYKAQEEFAYVTDYRDGAKYYKKCEQSLPKNGSLMTSNGSQCKLTISVPKTSNHVYLKLYNSRGKCAATVFIRHGNKATLRLAAGTYTMKIAYGSTWYGKKDLFGEYGSYQQLMNGSSKKFELRRNYVYSLQLQSATNGNVGSESLGGADDM